MSQKAEKPTLSGQRLKTRKRDEKEKYDPSYFRDELIKGLNKTDSNDLEAISKFLDSTGNRLDYRRYSDVLFDILFAGGQLAPGGSIIEEPDHECRTQHCVFTCDDNVDALRRYYDIFIKLIRRYQYLEKAFEAALTKIMKFLRGFSPEERSRLARFTSLLLANGCCTAKVIIPIFDENLVKDGISKTFATILFKTWLKEKDVASVYSMLKKANIENKLSELLPPNKRSLTNIQAYFNEQCLGEIAEMIRMQAVLDLKKELNKNLKELIDEEKPVKEIVAYIKEQTVTNSLPEHDVVVLVWKRLMAAVEWNKKEELVAEQALKHLRGYIAVLAANSTTRKAEMALITRVQEFCYDNMNFMNVFHKIIVLFYKADVLSEEAIIRWYKTDHLAKGKSVFLDQLKIFVTWLETAEEESDDDNSNDKTA